MKTNDLFSFWESGNKQLFNDSDISKDALLGYIKKNTKATSLYFEFNILFYCVFILACIIMASMNIPGYAINPVIKPLLIIQLIVLIGFFAYGITIFIKLRELKHYQESTYDLIKRQLKFYRVYHEIWIIIASVSVILLIFNLGIMVDYTDGTYPINNKKLYITINVGLLIFIYLSQKGVSYINLRKLKFYLTDLKSGILNESRKIEKQKKWIIIVISVLVLIFTITFILGLIKMLS